VEKANISTLVNWWTRYRPRLARQVRRDRRLVPALDEPVHRVTNQPELQQHRVPAQKVELAPRGLRPRVEVYDAQRLAQLDVVLGLEGELRDVAPAAYLDVLGVVLADWGVGVGHVGDPDHLLPQPPLDLRELPFFLRDALLRRSRLGDEPLSRLRIPLLAHALCEPVLLLPQLVELLHQRRAPVGQLHDKPHVHVHAPVPGVLGDGLHVLADEFEIEHMPPSNGS
jgi:hypothetical protein